MLQSLPLASISRPLKAVLIVIPALAALRELLKQLLGGPWRDRRLSAPLPPRVLGLPFLGSTFAFISGPAAINRKFSILGDVLQMYLLGEWTMVCRGGANLHKIFLGEGTIVKEEWPDGTRGLLGPDALATQSGATHTAQRRLMQNAFKPDALARYTPEIVSIVQKHMERWSLQPQILGFDEIKAMAFEVAAVAFMHFEYSEEKAASLRKSFLDYTDALFLPTWTPAYKKGMHAREYITDVIEKSIQERLQQADAPHQDLLQLMIEATDTETGARMTLAQLKDQALLQLFAGHDTTASTMTAMMWYLGTTPAVLRRALEEQHAVCAKFTGKDAFCAAALAEMPYLDAVVKECLRMKTPVGGSFRRAVQSFELSDGSGGVVQVPKGAKIFASIQGSIDGMDLQEPDRFMPDRWLTSSTARIASVADVDSGFAPFAAGKRKCLGFPLAELETRIFGAMLLRNLNWKLKSPQAAWLTFPIPRPSDGMPLQASKRVATKSHMVSHGGS